MGRFRTAAVVVTTLLAGTATTSAATTLRGGSTSEHDSESEQVAFPMVSTRRHDELYSTITSSNTQHDMGHRQADVDSTHRRDKVLTIPSSFNVLDNNLASLSILSAKIASCVNKEDPSTVDECSNALTFESTWSPDKAIVVHAEQHGICFGAFQATTRTADDWAQNLDRGMVENVCSPFNGRCCSSRRGFHSAYYNVSYLADFEDAVDDCKQKCSGGDCDVILTGYSQGGAVAVVGALYLNPTAVITFGQPPTCEEPCKAFDAERIYRFVNTIVVNGDLRYDIVPFLSWGATDHMGHLFVLGEDTQNVAYYKNHEAPAILFNDWSYTSVGKVHSMTSYIDRLEAFKDFPIGLDGWAVGESCTDLDTECSWPHICVKGKCSSGENDSRCEEDEDCLSKRCDGIPKRCKPKLSAYEDCNENSDCISEDCTWGWRCAP